MRLAILIFLITSLRVIVKNCNPAAGSITKINDSGTFEYDKVSVDLDDDIKSKKYSQLIKFLSEKLVF